MPSMDNSVEALMAQMRESYLRELPEKFNELESLVLESSQDRGVMEALYRATHSLKGTAGTYGLGLISNICHNLEDCFALFRDRHSDSERSVQIWLRYVDLLRETQSALEQNNSDEAQVLSALDALRRSYDSRELRGLLVVESALDRAVVEQAFGLGAVSLVVVEDGLQAMERLLLERFDFYVLGNQLPRLNGPSIVTAIRSNSGINRNAPCILLSSHTPELYGRKTDPDFVVTRDNCFVEHLDSAVNQLLAMLRD